MEVHSRLIVRIMSAALVYASVIGPRTVHAQPPAQNPPPITTPLPDGQDGKLTITVSDGPGGMLLDVDSGSASMASLFEEIARKCKLSIIVSDEVRQKQARFSGIKFKQTSPDALIGFLVKLDNLSLGKVGKDTYLIVDANPMVVELKIGRGRPGPSIQPKNEEDKPNPNWTPFDFNGSQFFYIPAAKPGEKSER